MIDFIIDSQDDVIRLNKFSYLNDLNFSQNFKIDQNIQLMAEVSSKAEKVNFTFNKLKKIDFNSYLCTLANQRYVNLKHLEIHLSYVEFEEMRIFLAKYWCHSSLVSCGLFSNLKFETSFLMDPDTHQAVISFRPNLNTNAKCLELFNIFVDCSSRLSRFDAHDIPIEKAQLERNNVENLLESLGNQLELFFAI